jgi:hypothetical protein
MNAKIRRGREVLERAVVPRQTEPEVLDKKARGKTPEL